MAFNMNQPLTVDGVEYDPTDFYQRRLLVMGIQPTNYEQFTFIDILAMQKNVKTTQNGEKSGGYAQASYRHNEIMDVHKFNAHPYPYYIDVVMTDIVDKKGNSVQLILNADFNSITELQITPRKPVAQATPVAPKV